MSHELILLRIDLVRLASLACCVRYHHVVFYFISCSHLRLFCVDLPEIELLEIVTLLLITKGETYIARAPDATHFCFVGAVVAA